MIRVSALLALVLLCGCSDASVVNDTGPGWVRSVNQWQQTDVVFEAADRTVHAMSFCSPAPLWAGMRASIRYHWDSDYHCQRIVSVNRLGADLK